MKEKALKGLNPFLTQAFLDECFQEFNLINYAHYFLRILRGLFGSASNYTHSPLQALVSLSMSLSMSILCDLSKFRQILSISNESTTHFHDMLSSFDL